MSYEPVTRLELEGYGCVRKAALGLTRLHALVGPNDSGKSTVLRGLRTIAQFAAGDFGDDPRDQPRPFDPLMGDSSVARVHFGDGLGYSISNAPGRWLHESVLRDGNETMGWDRSGWNQPSSLQRASADEAAKVRERLTVATMVRWEPDFLRAASPLIPDRRGIAFNDEKGRGLASVFDAIVNRDVASFLRIQEDVRRLFPTVDKIRLSNTDNAHKALAVSLVDGTPVDARAMSEGLLYFLAFSALRYIDGSRIFLVEEPENGLHPARIADVMNVLREIAKESQVVIATHSPLVLNELQGNEVTVLTRDSSGTHATLIANTPNFLERSEVYSLGELWVSYANGQDEAPLLNGGSRA